MPNRHPTTRAAFIEELQRNAPLRWPAIWGVACAHIEACLEAAYVELERLLAIPEMHRTRLKREMRQVLRLIVEEGPEGPARLREGGVVLPLPLQAVKIGWPPGDNISEEPVQEQNEGGHNGNAT